MILLNLENWKTELTITLILIKIIYSQTKKNIKSEFKHKNNEF